MMAQETRGDQDKAQEVSKNQDENRAVNVHSPMSDEQPVSKTVDEETKLRCLRNFDLSFYKALYPDLALAGITNAPDLTQHYLDYGIYEERFGDVRQWLISKEMPGDLLDNVENWIDVIERVRVRFPDIKLDEVLENLIRPDGPSYEFFEVPDATSVIYTSLARFYLARGSISGAEEYLKKAIRLDASNGTALEYLGNIETDRGNPANAIRFYNLALAAGNEKDWLLLNLSRAHTSLGQLDIAYDMAQTCLRQYPEFTMIEDHLDVLAEALWQQTETETSVAIILDQRDELVARIGKYARNVYDMYLLHHGVAVPPAYLGDINADRILIIGDYAVPQCKRYRVDQKIEQMESLGIKITALDWIKLDSYIDELPFYDIVIFYRVPALPKVLKAMAQVTAAGKLAIYEIDDLIFEPVYPPPLHTYGSLVDEHMYNGLMKGMALYNAAAKCCRIGLGSTMGLADRLAPLTQSGQCLLHRNGLDTQNIFRLPERNFKENIDIFYGSGTKAHSSDLIEIIIPVMEKVLPQYPKARFVMVGYAQLPESFVKRFEEQVVYLPLTDTVKAYYETLQWADINLAVLTSDEINDCKSELKWFEAACFGIPSVLSSTANYRDVIEDGVDGFLASNTDEWVAALSRLLDDGDFRADMGQKAHDRVKVEYAPEFLGDSLLENIKTAILQLQMPERSRVKKPKIAVVNVFMRPQSIGGATRVVEDNLDSFVELHGHAFEYVLFSSDVNHRSPHRVSVHMDGECRNYRSTILHQEHMDWVPRDPEMYRLFTDFLETERPDCVHFHCVQRLTASVVEAARDAGVPYIVTAHDAWWISDHQFLVTADGHVFLEGHPDPFSKDVSPPGISHQASLERRNYLKSLLFEATAVTTVSDGFAEIYRRNGLTMIQSIRNGISAARDWRQKDTSARKRVVIGHVGGISTHKGYDLFRDTVQSLDLNNIEILIADHSMEEFAIRRDRWGNVPVTFTGRVAQSRVVDLYRQIDVLAAPSIWPESFGLVTREAAACLCWVIASDIGGIGEDVVEGKNGFIISPDPASLAEVLMLIDAEPEKFKAPAQPEKIRYATEQAAKLANLYSTIVSSKGALNV